MGTHPLNTCQPCPPPAAANLTAQQLQKRIRSVADLPGKAVGTWDDPECERAAALRVPHPPGVGGALAGKRRNCRSDHGIASTIHHSQAAVPMMLAAHYRRPWLSPSLPLHADITDLAKRNIDAVG